MRTTATFVLAGIMMTAGAGLVSPSGDTKPRWHADFAAAQEQARRENRPIFAVLHCGH